MNQLRIVKIAFSTHSDVYMFEKDKYSIPANVAASLRRAGGLWTTGSSASG